VTGPATDLGVGLVTFLVGGVFAVFAFSLMWDFVRGLIRG
jgi:hypothetical protein